MKELKIAKKVKKFKRQCVLGDLELKKKSAETLALAVSGTNSRFRVK